MCRYTCQELEQKTVLLDSLKGTSGYRTALACFRQEARRSRKTRVIPGPLVSEIGEHGGPVLSQLVSFEPGCGCLLQHLALGQALEHARGWWRHPDAVLPWGFPQREHKERGVEPEAPGVSGADMPKSGANPRLRKRGRLTNQLAVLGSQLSRGWWRDLPSSSDATLGMNFLMKFCAPGTKLGVVNQVRVVRGEAQGLAAVVEVLFSSENGTRPLWVCPELVASLFTVRCFRPVDAGLLASLRSRARLWARDVQMSDLDLAFILPGSVMLAALPQPDEVVALGALRSSAAVFSATALRGLEDGTVSRSVPARSLWGTLRIIFGGGDDAVNRPVCDRLNLGSK